jgi:hypothetical protein
MGRQPLEIDHCRDQQALHPHLEQTTPPCSTQPVPLLSLGEHTLNNRCSRFVKLAKTIRLAVCAQSNQRRMM